MPELSATATSILKAGSERDGYIVLPLPEGITKMIGTQSIGSLLTKGMIEEVEAAGGDPVHRNVNGKDVTLAVTDAGLRAIGIAVPEATESAPAPTMEEVMTEAAPAEPETAPLAAETVPAGDTAPEGEAEAVSPISAADTDAETAPEGEPAQEAQAEATASEAPAEPVKRKPGRPRKGEERPKVEKPAKAARAPKAPKPPKEPKAPRAPKAEGGPVKSRDGTKQATMIAMLRNGGATTEEIVKATGWNNNTVRGAISGALKKKLGLDVHSEKVEGRGRVYSLPAA